MPFKDPSQHAETIKGYTKKYRLKQAAIPYEEKVKPAIKTCYICKTEKPIEQFHRDKVTRDGHTKACRECSNKKSKLYRCKSVEQRAAYAKKKYAENPYMHRDNQLLRLYGITLEQFNDLVKLQNDKCAICQTDNPGNKKNWNVDHDHKTGKVRGLLCWSCNSGIGKLNDNPALLLKAAIYILNSQNAPVEQAVFSHLLPVVHGH
jgi:hypothetical protein